MPAELHDLPDRAVLFIRYFTVPLCVCVGVCARWLTFVKRAIVCVCMCVRVWIKRTQTFPHCVYCICGCAPLCIMSVGGILVCSFPSAPLLSMVLVRISDTSSWGQVGAFCSPPAMPGFHLRSLVSYILLYPQGVQAIQLHSDGSKDSLSLQFRFNLQIIADFCCHKTNKRV